MRRKEETSHHQQLQAAKSAYKSAVAEGNRQEEARWANLIGDILKNRGEYVAALQWLRKDYDVSLKYLPEKQLLPTCQSLGELYLRLHRYKDALIYQKKHLELANDANDLIEQQRASTQLGRTYHEMFSKSDDDHYSIRNAKKYFKNAMKHARTLKQNHPSEKVSFTKEYIDAYNNLGMLEIDLDNLDEAERILSRGLEICDEEEVAEDDDARSRLHHNLGNVCLELRRWEKAHGHIKKDIMICKRIGHLQGEAKGYINLGELHYRTQKYTEAISLYHKALDLAKSLEDEDVLVDQIDGNIEVVREAIKVMDGLKKEEQNLKKLERNTELSRGTKDERKCLLQQDAAINSLIDKARMIISWIKFREYGKKKKRVASELCDKEKLSDSFLVIGEAYQHLRKFGKALKWLRKGWDFYRSIGNLEGQAMTKINIGNILDTDSDWAGALDAFKEGYRTATYANLPSLQISALQNMHYIYMIRADDIEEARKTKSLIHELKQSNNGERKDEDLMGNCCSETKTELDNQSVDDKSDASFSPKRSSMKSSKSKNKDTVDELSEDTPLRSLLQFDKKSIKRKAYCGMTPDDSLRSRGSTPQSTSTSNGSFTVSRKRVRVIISDDDGEEEEANCSERIVHNCTSEGVATSNESTKRYSSSPVVEVQNVSPVVSRCTLGGFPINLEKSNCSSKSKSSKLGLQDAGEFRVTGTCAAIGKFGDHENVNSTCAGSCNLYNSEVTSANVHACCDETCHHIICKFDEDLVHLDMNSFSAGDKLNTEQIKIELTCLYYLQLSRERRSRGLVPVIQHIKCNGKILDSTETLYAIQDHTPGKGLIEISIAVMVPKFMMKLYVDCCDELSVSPNLQVVKKLYNLQVSDDVIVVSDCELQDVSVAPLLNALQLHKTFAVLDLSHNLLGNGTLEKLKHVFISSGQSYGGLVLNLHQNQLGPTALFQICECPILFARLEVLDMSGNCLTDACASYLSTILQNCKALHSLGIENCSITSLTIQRLADSLDSGSVLVKLCIGYNRPVSRNAISTLLLKLGALKRFQELNLNGIMLSKLMVDSICQLSKDCCLSGLMLGNTNIGTDNAIHLIKSLPKDTQELVKLDLSFCGLTHGYIISLGSEVSLISSILELNISGNPIMKEGGSALASFLSNPQCCLRVLMVSNCQLSRVGILHILQSLSGNCFLEELNVAENVGMHEIHSLMDTFGKSKECSNSMQKELHHPASTMNTLEPENTEALPQVVCVLNTHDLQLEVADSEDDQLVIETAISHLDDGCACSSQKRASLSENQFLQELVASIKMCRRLQLLDLSCNYFSQEIVEMLFSAWSSECRAGVAQRHIEEDIVHLSVQGNKCCGTKPCCRRF